MIEPASEREVKVVLRGRHASRHVQIEGYHHVETFSLGASTWTYLQKGNLQAAVRLLRTLGYSRFDVLTIPPYLWPHDIDVAQRRALRDLLVTESIKGPASEPLLGSGLHGTETRRAP